MSQGLSCTLLLVVDWTAAIVYLQVSAASCYKGCKWSRMLPLVLSQEPEDQSIWRLFYVIFTGCRFDSASHLRQQFWSTVPSNVLRAHVNSASSIRSLRPTDCSMHQNKLLRPQLRRPRTSGVELLNYVHWTRCRCSETDLRHFCSICNCYTAHLQLLHDLALMKGLFAKWSSRQHSTR